MKFTKLANVLVPAVAVLTMAFGSTPARAQQKVKIGVAMALFDDVWLT
jgi:ABC-type sugar transport system substrate-binding protein